MAIVCLLQIKDRGDGGGGGFFLIMYFLKITSFRLMFFGHLPSNAYSLGERTNQNCEYSASLRVLRALVASFTLVVWCHANYVIASGCMIERILIKFETPDCVKSQAKKMIKIKRRSALLGSFVSAISWSASLRFGGPVAVLAAGWMVDLAIDGAVSMAGRSLSAYLDDRCGMS